MRWLEPLFVHFHVPRANVEPCVPPGLTLDSDGDDALITVTALGVIGPAPAIVTATPLRALVRYRQLNVRTYVNGMHGPGLLLLDSRVDQRWPLAARAIGLPYRHDRALHYEVDDSAVALRADGVAIRGLPAPASLARPARDGLERLALERYVVYGRPPRGSVYAVKLRHEPWRLRDVELAPDATLQLPELTPIGELAPTRALSAQLGATVDVRFEEIALVEAPTGRLGRAALSLVQTAL